MVAVGPADAQPLLERQPRLGQIPKASSDGPLSKQPMGGVPVVPKMPRECEALLAQCLCSREVTLRTGETGRKGQGNRARWRSCRRWET